MVDNVLCEQDTKSVSPSRIDKKNSMLPSVVPELVLNEEKESVNQSSKSAIPKRLTRKFWFYGIAAAVPILMGSLITAYVMWFTDLFHDEVLQHIVLKEGNEVYQLWTDSPIPNIIHFHAFNYTNIDEIMSGAKPVVSESGPYVFREITKRVNVVNNMNGTMTFQELHFHEFLPELSNGTLDDEISVPNIPLLAAIADVPSSRGMAFLGRIGLLGLKTGLGIKPFLKLKVGHFIWGFSDDLSKVTRVLAVASKRQIPESVGILAMRAGLSRDHITVGTGTPDLSNLGIISRFNGKERIGIWKSEECDSLEASDGTLFPGKTLSRNSTLHIYIKDFCRRLPLIYKEDVTTENGFPAYRFIYPDNIFASGDINADNTCFCNSSCLSSGAFDCRKCMYGAPIAVSFPHFLHGSKELRDGVIGLQPDPKKHTSYMDIHSKFGLPLAGQNRFQLNIYIRDSYLLSTYNSIADGTVLPLAWLGFEIGEGIESVNKLLNEVSFKSTLIDITVSWGSLLLIIVSGCFIAFAIRKILEISRTKLISELILMK